MRCPGLVHLSGWQLLSFFAYDMRGSATVRSVPGQEPMVVAIVSEHDLVSRGLASILQSIGALAEPVDLAHGLRLPQLPSVVVYDASLLASRDSLELDQLVGTGVPVVVLTSDQRPDLHAQAVFGRRVATVQASMTATQIADVVLAAANGTVRGLSAPVPVADEPTLTLSPREVQVLTLISQGRSNDEIAKELFLSMNSIKTYIRTLYRKLGVTRRSQAVVWAATHGFPVNEPSN